MNAAVAQRWPDVDERSEARGIVGDVSLSYVLVLRASPFFYVRGDDGIPHWTTERDRATKFGTSEAARQERRERLGLFRAIVQAWLERPDSQELVVWNEEE